MTEPNQCVKISLSVSCESYLPQPPKCCDDCSDHEWDCKKTCYEKPKLTSPRPTPTPNPTSECCDDCLDHDWDCKKTCYEKSKPIPSLTPCDDCHHRDWDCKKICHKKPKTTTRSHPAITYPYYRHHTASHCGHCEHNDRDCHKTCYTTIKTTTTSTSTSTRIHKHKATPKPKKVCVECKEIECDDDCKPLLYSAFMGSNLNKRAGNHVDGTQHLNLTESAYNGRPHCSSCEKHDDECEAKCIVVKITKETVVCTDCEKHEEPHRCKHECVQPHLKPICCDDCKKGDDSCKKTCYEKPKPKTTHQPKPVCCDECKEDEDDCKKTCYEKPKPKPTFHPKPVCDGCKEHEHECKKTCSEKPKPEPNHPDTRCDECKEDDDFCLSVCMPRPSPSHSAPPKFTFEPVCCDDCEAKDWKCKETCYEKPKPKPTHRPKPIHKSAGCGECKWHNFSCLMTCYLHRRPHPRPSPPPPPPKHTSKPVCCDECKEGQWECIKTCYQKPTPSPKPTLKPVPCCHECKHEEHDCHKVCEQKCEYQPHGSHSRPKSTPWHQPATPSQGKIPGQLYGACPADLSGDYQSPHLIIPVSSAKPYKAYGSSYNGYVSDVKSTIFNFDFPEHYSGKTCSLFFMLPSHDDLETSDYSLSGQGSVHFDVLYGTATTETNYANQPDKALHLNDFPLASGTTYWVADHPCPGGESVAFEMSASGVNLEYFQDYNPSPIGLYIRAC
jgi:hypothetical protein